MANKLSLVIVLLSRPASVILLIGNLCNVRLKTIFYKIYLSCTQTLTLIIFNMIKHNELNGVI